MGLKRCCPICRRVPLDPARLYTIQSTNDMTHDPQWLKVMKLQSTGHVSSGKLHQPMTSRRSTPFWPLPRPKWKNKNSRGLIWVPGLLYIYIYHLGFPGALENKLFIGLADQVPFFGSGLGRSGFRSGQGPVACCHNGRRVSEQHGKWKVDLTSNFTESVLKTEELEVEHDSCSSKEHEIS